VSSSPEQPESEDPHRQGLTHAMRMLGHDLRLALARATSITERLARHLVAGAPTHRDLGDLRYALSEADYVAEALLDGTAELNVDRPALCVNSFLLELEPLLRETLNPAIVLSVRLSATAGVVSATTHELDAIVRSLIDNATRAIPDGGELTIATGWLDIAGIALRDRVSSRHHVRLTITATQSVREGEPSGRAVLSPDIDANAAPVDDHVSAMISELGGCLVVESADGADRRLHVCLRSAV
jgi:signal transduction histidine kinase